MVQFTPPLFSEWGTSSFSTPIPSVPTREFHTITVQPKTSRSISMVRYTRETSLFNSALNFNNNAIGPSGTPPVTIPIVVNPFGTSPGVNPIAFNQFTARASATKQFGEGFASVSGTAFYIAYDHGDNNPAPFSTSHDGTSVWLSGRAGYHFVPGVYAFGEVDGIWQRYNNSIFDTNGYRVLGGIGTDDKNSLVPRRSLRRISVSTSGTTTTARFRHPARLRQSGLWRPCVLLPNAVLDVDCIGR